jgi:hypothetical protein
MQKIAVRNNYTEGVEETNASRVLVFFFLGAYIHSNPMTPFVNYPAWKKLIIFICVWQPATAERRHIAG